MCGRVKHDLKLKDCTYECRSCHATDGRDAGAARNIMMLYFEDEGIDLSGALDGNVMRSNKDAGGHV